MFRFGMVRCLGLGLAVLMVALGAAWGADAAVSDEGLPELFQLNTELDKAKEELEAVRQRAFEADPNLQYSIELMALALKLDSDITQERLRVAACVRREAQRRPDADIKQMYANLRGAMGDSLKHKSALAMLEHPQQRPLALFLMRTYWEDRVEKTDGMSDEVLAGRYLALLESAKTPTLQKVHEIRDMAIFPAFVFEHVENEAEVSSLWALADLYIRLNTPEELKLAEDKVSNLQAKRAKLLPVGD
jgi:hypothetical protein